VTRHIIRGSGDTPARRLPLWTGAKRDSYVRPDNRGWAGPETQTFFGNRVSPVFLNLMKDEPPAKRSSA
jgi:hypothetical protein